MGISGDRKELKLFLEDGSRIFDNEDLQDEGMIQGKLLLLATSMDDMDRKNEVKSN